MEQIKKRLVVEHISKTFFNKKGYFVITSYSIHYTKLYEVKMRLRICMEIFRRIDFLYTTGATM